jgi:autotransporter-associated beta strand protein
VLKSEPGPNQFVRLVRLVLVVIWLSQFVGLAQAGTLYWDTDNSATGNNASTGANLGGSGNWSNTDSNWWSSTSPGILQAWIDGSDAIFWGTPGSVTATTISARSLAFKTSDYTINSGILALVGNTANINVASNVIATIDSTIDGTNTIAKLGPGTLVLSNPSNINTATTTNGGWRIEEGGTLVITADESLGAALPDGARNTITDIQLNQSTIQAAASFDLSINRRTKINTNASTNRGDAIIDTHGNVLRWFGSLQGGPGSLRVINSGPNPGLLILGTDKIANINPFGSSLPAGAINLTIQDGAIVQTSGTVTPTGGELGSETGIAGAVLAIKLDHGQIRSESGGYTFQRNLILGAGGGSLDTGAWEQTFLGTVIGPGSLTKEGTGILTLDNSAATWIGGTVIHSGTLQLGRSGSYGLLPGTINIPSSVAISSGAVLKFSRGSDKSFYDTISGAGGVTVANTPSSIVRLVSNSTYTGPTTILSGTLMIGEGNPGYPGSIVSSNVENSATLVFNRAENISYAGAISGSGEVIKQSAGRLTLTGTNTYTGNTTVTEGTLWVNGAVGDSAVIVSGGTLGGNGLIEGPVTIQSSGRLAPGTSIGALTISNSLTLSGNTIMEVNPLTGTNDVVLGLTSVTYGGRLTLTTLAGSVTASSIFKLFSADSYHGAFTAFTPANPGSGLAWDTNTLATDGTLRVSTLVSTAPVTITNKVSGNFLTLSWPTDHIGWHLQNQTNTIQTGLSTNWLNVPNSSTTNQMIFPIDSSVGTVFYRLVYP